MFLSKKQYRARCTDEAERIIKEYFADNSLVSMKMEKLDINNAEKGYEQELLITALRDAVKNRMKQDKRFSGNDLKTLCTVAAMAICSDHSHAETQAAQRRLDLKKVAELITSYPDKSPRSIRNDTTNFLRNIKRVYLEEISVVDLSGSIRTSKRRLG